MRGRPRPLAQRTGRADTRAPRRAGAPRPRPLRAPREEIAHDVALRLLEEPDAVDDVAVVAVHDVRFRELVREAEGRGRRQPPPRPTRANARRAPGSTRAPLPEDVLNQVVRGDPVQDDDLEPRIAPALHDEQRALDIPPLLRGRVEGRTASAIPAARAAIGRGSEQQRARTHCMTFWSSTYTVTCPAVSSTCARFGRRQRRARGIRTGASAHRRSGEPSVRKLICAPVSFGRSRKNEADRIHAPLQSPGPAAAACRGSSSSSRGPHS